MTSPAPSPDAKDASARRERIAAFLVPLLIASALIYRSASDLQIVLMRPAALAVIGVMIGVAALIGGGAAVGAAPARTIILAACAFAFLDVTFHLSGFFHSLSPESRAVAARDGRRIQNIHAIRVALEKYVSKFGALPMPGEYGQGIGGSDFWGGWWDVSSDGEFLPFLVDGGILSQVPLDPSNANGGDDVREGMQYVYLLVPPDYDAYAGGACSRTPTRWYYLLAITDLESETARPPRHTAGSGCSCLWRDAPDYFQRHFDYVICGTLESTPEVRTRMLSAVRAQTQARASALAELQGAEERRKHIPDDERRVADLRAIDNGVRKYLRKFGRLPAPAEYGESERSPQPTFWQYYWDVSGEDGDGDGVFFLDFLVDSGVMPRVPLDPENTSGSNGDPRGGSQYAYFLLPPGSPYEGGPCAEREDRWHYMLAITDLKSEVARPPRRFPESGCSCLWRDSPNYFENHFDYVLCGSFVVSTPAFRAEGAEPAIPQPSPADAIGRQDVALDPRQFIPQDNARVADLEVIKAALETYIERFGALPTPAAYGEAEPSRQPTFWQHHWDLSGHDGDGDGNPFLDFLIDGGVLSSVPLDPENEESPDGDPRGGRQYVYFLLPPGSSYGGGTCDGSASRWHYMVAITDMRSEGARPTKLAGSSCPCLWRDLPDYFQLHFDYVLCGYFDVESKNEAAQPDAGTGF